MPLSSFQIQIARLLSKNRSVESRLAGGAALHFQPNSIRYSEDLDYFHDAEAAVVKAFVTDNDLLQTNGYILHPVDLWVNNFWRLWAEMNHEIF